MEEGDGWGVRVWVGDDAGGDESIEERGGSDRGAERGERGERGMWRR